MSVAQYQVGQLFACAKASRLQNEEGKKTDGSGVDINVNEPYENEEMGVGQYTEKTYHLGSNVPGFLRKIMPKNALLMEEKAWNGYPHCKTVLSSPFFGDKVKFIIETMHLPGRGDEHNPLNLTDEQLAEREVIIIDIAHDEVEKKHYKEEEDPKLVASTKAGVGPFTDPQWIASAPEPFMTCYKLVTIEFKYWGLQTKVEQWAQGFERGLFTRFHRQVYCWMDEWYDFDMIDIRAYEAQTMRLLAGEDISTEPPIPRPKLAAASAAASAGLAPGAASAASASAAASSAARSGETSDDAVVPSLTVAKASAECASPAATTGTPESDEGGGNLARVDSASRHHRRHRVESTSAAASSSQHLSPALASANGGASSSSAAHRHRRKKHRDGTSTPSRSVSRSVSGASSRRSSRNPSIGNEASVAALAAASARLQQTALEPSSAHASQRERAAKQRASTAAGDEEDFVTAPEYPDE